MSHRTRKEQSDRISIARAKEGCAELISGLAKRAQAPDNQIPPGYYDEVYRRAKGIQSKWHHLKFARIYDELKDSTRHLDIGCGPGTFIGTLGEEYYSVGIDTAISQIDFARQSYGNTHKSFQCIIDEDLTLFPDESFDVVTIIDLFEHLLPEQNQRLLKEAIRVLRPEGRLIVSTPNYGGLWPILETLLNWWGPISYANLHITQYTKASLTHLIEMSGLEEVSVNAYMFAAPFTACFGWHFADLVAQLEPKAVTKECGFLLLATARKPS